MLVGVWFDVCNEWSVYVVHAVVSVELVFLRWAACNVNEQCAWFGLVNVGFVLFEVNFKGSSVAVKVWVGCSVG